jgi:hypothetical protein
MQMCSLLVGNCMYQQPEASDVSFARLVALDNTVDAGSLRRLSKQYVDGTALHITHLLCRLTDHKNVTGD